jgi:hypothetical protein
MKKKEKTDCASYIQWQDRRPDEVLGVNDLVLDVDKNRLDDEWLNQPGLYFRWSLALEQARDDLEHIKAEFDVVKSELDLSIRTNPDDYDLPKVTDKSVAAALITQPDYKDAQQDLFEAKHRVGILQAAVAALEQRKRSLEKLVDLHGQQYFATPRASEDSREAMEEVEKRSVRRRSKHKSGK